MWGGCGSLRQRRGRARRSPSIRHSREGGNPYWLASRLEARGSSIWIPASAGMTAYVGRQRQPQAASGTSAPLAVHPSFSRRRESILAGLAAGAVRAEDLDPRLRGDDGVCGVAAVASGSVAGERAAFDEGVPVMAEPSAKLRTGLVRHPRRGIIEGLWFAARWTPDQVRGDGRFRHPGLVPGSRVEGGAGRYPGSRDKPGMTGRSRYAASRTSAPLASSRWSGTVRYLMAKSICVLVVITLTCLDISFLFSTISCFVEQRTENMDQRSKVYRC